MKSPTPALPSERAFTLIELLVVIVIIAVLASIVLPVVHSAQSRAQLVRETNAARNIMVAYFCYATEHDGQLLPGYDKTVESVTLQDGASLTGEMVHRYPWRLAPYIGGQIEDIFLVNGSRTATQKYEPTSFDYQYRASLYPALGINAYCVGGYEDGTGSGYFSSDVVRRLGNTAQPSRLIVFTSAHTQASSKEVDGYFIVTPPRFWRSKWSTTDYDPKASPSDKGNVAFRWDEKAVCSMLDGHVELLTVKEASDMRHWSGTAIENDNANFTVPR